MKSKVKLNADIVEGFAGVYLSGRYDDAKPTPQFHREAWALYTSDEKQAMVIAPRDHAKSTALTYDYTMAEVCFRSSQYVIIIGSTEPKAAEQLSNIAEEINTNEDLRRDFDIVGFETEQKTEIIVKFGDGHRFRILARGAEQKIRGAMWNGMRPDLIVCDDMEDDEQVENKERRVKFRKWFFRAAKQALSKRGKIRVHGTILHMDSLLSRLRVNKVWKHLFFKAHKSYSDFTELLWPDRWTEADLREKQKEFEEDGDGPGYSQEFLNTPLDSNEAYLREEGFIPMKIEDYEKPKRVVCGADFAVTKKDSANQTAFTAAGQSPDNLVHIIGHIADRWKSDEWVDEMFDFDSMYQPEYWIVEKGQIWDSVKPFIDKEMMQRDHWIDFRPVVASKDKAVRGQGYRKRHRAGGMRYDTQASWYQAYKAELLTFTGVTEALLDDRFDSTVYAVKGFDLDADVEEEDFMTDEELEELRMSEQTRGAGEGRRSVTGY